MRVRAQLNGLGAALVGATDRLKRGVTGGMRRAADGLKGDLRGQVERAGLGARLANTWRGTTYPQSGASLHPAGFVYSKAPDIVTTFSSDIVIRPVAGSRYLWIPTDNVPRGGGRGSKKIGPSEVEAKYGRKLIIRPARAGRNKIALLPPAPASGGRKRRRGRRADRNGMVHMFTLVPFVRGQRLLQLDRAAETWGGKVPGLIDQELARDQAS